jgi:hypothetical protein
MTRRRRTLLDLLSDEIPPRFVPPGTPYPFMEKGRCRWCGGLVTPPRRTWCSDECVDSWGVLTSPAIVRNAVWERDQGVCSACGSDCTTYTTDFGRVINAGRWGPWDADHIVPVWRGGGLCGLDGYQTLCRDCHSAKTAHDASERAAIARAGRPDPEPAVDPNQLELAIT